MYYIVNMKLINSNEKNAREQSVSTMSNKAKEHRSESSIDIDVDLAIEKLRVEQHLANLVGEIRKIK